MYIKYKPFIFLTVSTKKHGQVFFVRKGYQDALLISFTATTLTITIDNHTGEKNIFSTIKFKEEVFPQRFGYNLVFHAVEFLMLE